MNASNVGITLDEARAQILKDLEAGDYRDGGGKYIEADPDSLRVLLAALPETPTTDDLCPECHGGVTSYFCDRCGNTGRVRTPTTDDERESLIDALMSDAPLIRDYDWLGTKSSWPSERTVRREVGEVADAVLAWMNARRPSPPTEERPYDEATDHEYAAWDTDAIEEHAHDLLAVVRHRRAVEAAARVGGEA